MLAVNGKELRRKRMSLGLSQIDLGKWLEIQSNTISRYERSILPVPKVVELAIETVERRIDAEEQAEGHDENKPISPAQ